MSNRSEQGELFGIVRQPSAPQSRLRVNDVIRIAGKLCRVVRVTECCAVVVMNRPAREFRTLFDKHVRFQPSPRTFRISANSELEIFNRYRAKQKRKRLKGVLHENV